MMPLWLAELLPVVAALAVAWEVWLTVRRERRRAWAMTRPAILARLFLLAVLAYLVFFLGRPVSTPGALMTLAVLARAVTDALAILGRHAGRSGPNVE